MSDLYKRLASLPKDKQEQLLRKLRERGGQAPRQEIPRQPRNTSTFPLSYAQQRLWFLDQLEPGSPLYNMPSAVRLEGALDLSALERSFGELVRRHEGLRTTFRNDEGTPVQVISPPFTPRLEVKDLRALPAEAREQEALRRMREEAQCSFDLAQGPLLRVLLFQLGEREHLLLLAMHHIVSDGWSMGILIREMAALYRGFATGKSLPLPDPSHQYADYATWQRDWLKGEVLESQLAYWRKQLAGSEQPLELPTDRLRPAVQTHRGALEPVRLSAKTSAALKELAKKENATPFMVLLAAFQTLLHRYTGQEHISVGSPIAGRGRSELEGIIGFFVNTLVLRTGLEGNPTFRELLARVREVTQGAYDHQDVPFEKLVDELQPERNLSRSPLFQVMFAFQSEPTLTLDMAGLTLHPLEVDSAAAKFDLSLVLVDGAEEFSGALDYNVDLFEASTASRMVGHLVCLLEGIAAAPDTRLSELPLLPQSERRQLLEEWNATRTEFPRNTTLHALFEAEVARRPEAVAVEDARERLTYRELDARANQLAWYLRHKGVGPDVRVCLCVDRSPELIIALLGILKAGGAYVPLDSTYPRERLASMVEDARPQVLVTTRRYLGALPTHGAQAVLLDEAREEIARQPTHVPQSGATARNLAYIDFTSGSTGRPKGVCIEHRSVARLVRGVDYANLESGHTFLLIAPISFDASTLEVWGCLLNGGRLVLFPAHAPGDVKELEELLARHQVTTLHLTAGLFTQMVDANLEGLRPVKQLLTGGDVVSAPHVRRTLEELRIPVTACYGPTESTTFASCFRMTRPEQVGNSVPIGQPIGNTQIYILDRHQHPLPAGMPGELYIGGDGLARGYLELPELTAEKFLPNPFSHEPGARMYRTGDLARFRPDGVLEFLGRIDSQVKIRGFRVELSEVETALLGHPEVREAVVVARQDAGSHKRLVAYVAAPKTLGVAELRDFLKEKLPEYMVPSAFVCLEALPLTPNGKVDRKALPAPESARTAEDRPHVAPRNATEQALAGIWAKVLGVERVGIHDNFFELGGDSIVSLQVIARARQAGLEIAPKQLFQRQTIAELAPVVGEARAPTGEQGVVKGPVPLTPIQRAFLESGQPEPHHFNQAVLLEVRERLDAALLERALQRLVEHHDALRMRFTREGSRWEQHNAGLERPLVLQRMELSSVTDAELPAAIDAAAARVQRGLELAEGLLLRAALMDLGPARPARLLLVIHHLVVDAVSWRTLLEDLSTACVQLRRGEAVTLPPKSTSFKAWAGRLQEYARSETLGRELARWVEECAPTGRPLPVDGPGGANTLASARELTVELEVEETRALLQEVPAAWRVRTDEVLLAALALGFQRWTGGSELRVELEGHGREDLFPGVDLSRTVGWFTSVYTVRLKAPPGASPGDVLRAVRDSLRQVPDRGIGYGLLRYLGEGEAVERLRALPRAEVAFNYLGQFDGTAAQASALFALAREPSGPATSEQGTRSHLLEVNGLVLEGRLRLTFTYSENLHTRATVETLAQGYLSALRGLIAQRTSADALRYTPADFPLAPLNRETLASVLPPGEPVEDVYPLSSMQQGFLFQVLLSPGSSVYVVQSSWSIHSPLDTRTFQRAWEALVERHAILRTSFRWEGLGEPVQVVHARPRLPWQELDWRGLPEAEQRARLESFLAEDRARGLELSRAPLMRVTVMRLAEGVHHIIWTHHHLLLDGWSLGLLFKELFAFYEAFARGERPTVEPAPHYREYIAWVRKQDFAQTEAWWRRALAGFPMPTPLPGDGTPDAKRDELDHQERRVLFTAATTTALQAFARQHQVTLNTLVQAAWGLVLARYSGERDVIFGTTVSGRPADLMGAEEMMGLFINTLPVRVQLRPGDTVVTWLQRLQAQQLEMRQYEHSPLVQVQTWSEVPRGMPLFDTLLVFENYPLDTSVKERSSTLDVRDFDTFERFTFPLTLTVVPGRELLLMLAAKTERFTADLAGQLLRHMQVLLESFLAHPAREPLALPMLTEAERQRVLVDWNDTQTERPWDGCVHELIETQATRTPQALAVVYEEGQLTFAELDRRANQLAQALRARGVGPEVRVALCMERSLEMVVGVLGILKAGGAYVPMDPAYPAQRLAFMLKDSRARLVLTQERLREQLAAHGVESLCLDGETLSRESDTAPTRVSQPGHLAYIIYTSGSTGQPKGVMIQHASVVNLRAALNETVYAGVEGALRVSVNAPLAFDASVKQLIQLANGHALCVIPEEARGDPRLLLGYLEKHRVEVLDCTPSLLRLMLAEGLGAPGSWAPGRVLVGGEAVDEATWATLSRHPRIACFNVYGPTECTVDATVRAVRGAPALPTIGRPLPNVRTYVLDERMEPTPVGVPGELYIGGAGLARGYHGRPELTAEKFVPNPFSTGSGARLYRTGDLVRYLSDGDLEYLGRIDHQVKLRGFRIELGEIESALGQYPAVKQAAVSVRKDGERPERLVAYVVAREGQKAKAGELRAFLQEHLPEYMVPSVFMALEALPLTTHGKVDRKALPAPELERTAESAWLAPRTPTEQLLASLWAQVLHTDKVGLRDNFFELGGHSLLATQVISRIRASFGVELPLRALFEAPVLEALASRIDSVSREGQGLKLPPLRPVARTGQVPLSFAQQRLWFLEQLDPGNTAYNLFTAVRMEGALDVAALERSFQELVRRHESLRTTFQSTERGALQVIHPEAALSLPLVDLGSVPAAELQAEILRLAREEAGHPFNLTHGPLLRVKLLKLGEAQHVLLLAMHHIVSDGWSMSILIREVAALYQAFSSGQPSPLPELPLQYADYASWQRSWLQGEALETQLAYWRQQLAHAPHVLELPTDKPRPAVQTYRGALHHLMLPAALSRAVTALGQKEGTTPFMVLLAAFQALLSRYSGQQDISVGSPIAGRTHADTEGLIGFFVNTLVLRTRLEGNPSFRELLARVRLVALGAYAHQDIPFEKLVEELKPPRSLSHSPLFQVMLAFQNTPVSRLEQPGLALSPLAPESIAAKFDLTLSLQDTPEGLEAVLEYNTDLFESATASRMMGHFQVLLEAATSHPELPLSSLPLLTEAERQQVLVHWNDTQADYPRDACLHSLIEAQVARTPDALAVVAEEGQLTYRQLDSRANQLAHHLRSLGAGPEVRVALCMERSLDMLVALLAILKAGATYVPLDPSYPSERLGFMLQDCGASVLLTQHALSSLLPAGPILVCLDTQWRESIEPRPASPVVSGVHADSPAYAIYTSGSTGQPKGTLITHRALANHMAWLLSTFGLTSEHRVLLKTPLSFDASVWECWAPLMVGAPLVIAPPEAHRDPAALLECVLRQRVSVLQVVPSMLRVLLDEPALSRATHLRWLFCGGEALASELAPRLAAALPQVRLVNLYGPTEATIDATFAQATAEATGPSIPIGRPVANTQVYVLDAALQPVPPGVPGELFIAGAQLARGYLGHPHLTAERFLPNPFSATPGERMYRTGDRVRWLADGVLEYLGRIDFQVKLRGQRIEPGEIESALSRLPGVRQALVLAREDMPGNQRLVAYLTAAEGHALDSEALRPALQRQLPEYMVPSAFLVLEALPLTPNGKVDRKALPAPDQGSFEARTHVAPRTPTEQLLASVWSQLLGVERVGSTDNFFELGGHSLLATQVISRVRASLGVELPLRALFEAPTLEALASRLDSASRESQGLKLPPLRPVSRTGQLPLSFAQQRLWFLEQLEPGLPTYHIPLALRLEGALDTSALERGIQELVRRHESLRTTFRSTEKEPIQVIHSELSLSLSVVDSSELPRAEQEAQVLRLAEEESQCPFDLVRGPLLRVKLLKLGETRHVLLLTMHHIVSDGWSTGILIREVGALYQAFSSGQPSPLPELPVQYADYASWQRSWLQGEALETQLAYWRQQLAQAPKVLELPTDKPRPPVKSYRGATLSRLMPRPLSNALEALCQREGVTPFMVLLAGFQTLLSRYSGQTDIVVGTDIAGRTHAETEGLIGFFINQLVMRGDLSGDPTFRELLGRVRQVALGAYAHQDVPFEELVRELNPERSLAHAPLFQVKLVLQNAPTPELRLPGLTFRGVESGTGAAKFDLTLAINETAEGLSCLCEYSTDLYEADTISRMFDHLRVLLEAATSNPDQRLSSLPLLTEAERRRVLVEWNDVRADDPQDVCAHQLFEAQVQRTPDAIAVQMGEDSLTYRQLDARANQLAWHLRSLGVGPDVRIGLCVERSLHLIVGILGILKAGGAYVPLDPSYPSERLAFMLRDSLTPVLLTQEHLADELPIQSELLVLLDAEWDTLIAAQPEHAPNVPVLPDNLAYVIYTSGSTGTPKGTLLHHRGLSNTALSTVTAHGFHPESRVLQFAASSFDASVCEVFSCLLAGACLVLASREDILPGAPLVSLLTSQRISAVTLTPSVLAQLEPSQLPSLRTVISAGEACSPELLSRWAPGRSFLNAYGPTEVTICASITGPLQPGQRLTIGRPLPNVQLFVLDERLRPVPVGVPGELFIGGPGLARGYLGRPALTAEKFVPNPFSTQPGARLYRTGDKVRLLSDGQLEFLGRLDSQVKLRGFRIELGEVESVLRSHSSVQQAVALVREDSPGDKRLVAYLVPHPGQSLDTSEARAFAREKLPEHMVPSAFVLLEAMPLTPSRKVDLKALPPPDSQRLEENDSHVSPRTPTEELLANLWSQLLGVARVGLHDNFFELGGHSLLATQLISRLRATFGVDLPIRELFEEPTVAAVAQALQARLSDSARQAPPLLPVPRSGALPLSFAQQRLWFLEQFEPGNTAYNLFTAVRMEGALDVAALERSFQELVRRHESLRTTFQSTEQGALQVIHPEASLPLPLVDLGSIPAAELQAEVLRLAREEARHPFNLTHGPLLRVKLLKLGEAQHVLLLAMHHIVSDGWSMSILIREVAALYQAFSSGQPSPLPELPLQYADYAAWQRSWLQGEALETQLAYWRQQLAHAPHVLELPTDKPRPPVRSHRGARLPVLLPVELSRAVTALGQKEGATPFMVFLAAFQALLSRYSGQQDISVGSPIAGRTHADTEGLIGFFVNTLVLRTRLEGNPSFRELLARVRQVALGAYAHQDIPFEKLVEELKPPRSLSHSPLFQVMLAFQNTPVSRLEQPGLALSTLAPESITAKFDLTLSLQDSPEGLEAVLEYNTDLFESATAARLLGHFQVLLEAATSQPELPLSSLPLLTEAERQQVLVHWNDTQADYPRDACLHHLIEAQVARTPDALAVVAEEGQLTYRQLDSRANQLAHHLRSLGVGPEVRVGVCAERSLELVVGLLAILKAGGAYVPLDPSLPRERLAFMLEDSGVPVLLLQERLRSVLPEQLPRCVSLDARGEELSARSTAPVSSGVTSENLAYAIYTSGSTGRPKLALNGHRAIVNRLHWMQEAYRLTAQDVVLQKTPYSFDVSVWEFFWPLLTGARLVMARPEGHKDPAYLRHAIQQHGVTTLHFVPSMLQVFIEEPGLEACTSLRRLICSGEALPHALQEHVLSRLPVELHNLYGPTEAAVDVSSWACVRGDARNVVPIGRPISNARLYVLDALLRPVPIGVHGELYIGGVAVGRGYHARPDLTAERFIPDPFSREPGARLYRTGDRVRLLPDGNIDFLGRMDFQVKVRGNRIELGEIEAVLGKHPSVGEAVVVTREDVPGDKRLVGYLLPRTGQRLDLAQLRDFARERLPEYMVPSLFMPLEALPLTSSGKVDRKSLPAPDQGRMAPPGLVPPRDTLEAMLVHLWEELLGVQPIGVRSNFFELGGHSLLAVRLMARIRELTGRSLPLATLFQEATIQHLAELLRREEEAGPWSPLVPLRRGGSARPFFLVHPVGGNVLCYAELARQLGPDQPLYALQAPGLKGEQPPLGTVEELAAYYLEALRAVQPTGPYLLGGWSMGGVVAYEMAQQFQRRGEQVELLALIDSSARRADAPNEAEVSRIALHFAWDLFRTAGMELQPPENLSALEPESLLEALLEQGRAAGLIAPGAEAREFRALFHVFESNLRASFRYSPRPYAGTVTLLRASEPPLAAHEDPDHGWSALAARVERHELSGDHYTLMQRPHVQGLAEHLKQCLARAHQAAGALEGGKSA